VQRALYLGSERRELSRVAIGAKIKYKHSSGLMAKNGVLSELSLRGCGLITKQALTVGEEVKVVVPSGVTEGPTLTLSGKVAGSVNRLVIEDGQSSAAVVFKGVDGATRKRIGNIMAANGMGPTGLLATPPGTPIGPGKTLEALEQNPQKTNPQQAESQPSDEKHSEEQATASGAERRTTSRGSYPQSVVGRSSSSTHSLIGRDLSVGGMRVAPEPELQLGARLRLAVYGTAGVRPVIVSAEVVRDDGENGLGLSFTPLPEAAKRRLQQIVDGLDELAEQSGSAGVLISEVLTAE
jgi:c-di-GMP-binding flagellar brake protein YcgR